MSAKTSGRRASRASSSRLETAGGSENAENRENQTVFRFNLNRVIVMPTQPGEAIQGRQSLELAKAWTRIAARPRRSQ
jgi:hypothetical protein